jgi:hypothetical protein
MRRSTNGGSIGVLKGDADERHRHLYIIIGQTGTGKLDRYLDFHFFTNEAGGNMMMFMNLIWAWGHPEVYILTGGAA